MTIQPPAGAKAMTKLEATSAFVRNLLAALLAVSSLSYIAWFWVGPRVTEWAEQQLGTAEVTAALDTIKTTQAQQAEIQRQQQQTIATISETQAKTADTLNAVVERIASLEKTARDDKIPPIKFMEDGNSISPGRIGDFVVFQFAFVKSRDCGRPVSTGYFINGGGITHAFRDKSTDAPDGRSPSGPVRSDVQTGKFIARIPANEGVRPTAPGEYASGYILMSWPDCPNVPALRSPLIPFQIMPAG